MNFFCSVMQMRTSFSTITKNQIIIWIWKKYISTLYFHVKSLSLQIFLVSNICHSEKLKNSHAWSARKLAARGGHICELHLKSKHSASVDNLYPNVLVGQLKSCLIESLTSEATHSATPFFKRAYKNSHPPWL